MAPVPRIGSVMTRRLAFIDAGATIHEAQSAMEQNSVRHLPVTQDDVLVGLLTDRDIKLSLDPMFGLPPMRKVRDIMTSDPYVVDVGETLEKVLSILTEHRVGAVLVTENGELAGIFTTTDAARMLRDHYRDDCS